MTDPIMTARPGARPADLASFQCQTLIMDTLAPEDDCDEVIYLDYNATTPVDPEVVDAVMPWLFSNFGNPSSGYPLGHASKAAIATARAQVAALLNVDDADEVSAYRWLVPFNHITLCLSIGFSPAIFFLSLPLWSDVFCSFWNVCVCVVNR
jgi:hypothetical protein